MQTCSRTFFKGNFSAIVFVSSAAAVSTKLLRLYEIFVEATFLISSEIASTQQISGS